ncbi:hypothetical protein Tco_0434234, partial [Tanacetum coccineum]
LSFLLDALFLLIAMDYAADSVNMLDGFCWLYYVSAGSYPSSAGRLVSAGCPMFLLVVLWFCW